MKWVKVEHNSRLVFKDDIGEWLADELNELGATQVHIIHYNPQNEVFDAVALINEDNLEEE